MRSVFSSLARYRFLVIWFFFFQAEDGIRDFCLSRGLGDVYKRQIYSNLSSNVNNRNCEELVCTVKNCKYNKDGSLCTLDNICLLYTSDAADEEDSVDLGGRRVIKKKKRSISRTERRKRSST
ncbi:hypothetical protein CDFC105_93859 [Clostridioides difficile]|nr:hypothetical protein CDFC105_93859 [Clostridioides difficile]